MDIYQEIQERLKRERDSGATQNEMSRRTGLGQSHISRLLDAKRGTEQMKRLGLETFFKLFPDARIVFGDEARVIGDVTNNKGQVVNGDVHGSVSSPGGSETAADFLKRIMDADNIDAETKVKIYKIINNE